MDSQALSPGQKARYPRTGTTGTVVRIIRRDGADYAELDATGLLYRTDQLQVLQVTDAGKRTADEDTLRRVEKEREYYSSSAFSEAAMHTDQSCEGGG